jgi:flavin-dependent dehydrogenase
LLGTVFVRGRLPSRSYQTGTPCLRLHQGLAALLPCRIHATVEGETRLFCNGPMSDPASVDAVVIGAGPAGSTTARQLAKLGYRVVLFHRPRGQPSGLPRWETISLITLQLIHAYHPDAHSRLQSSLVPVTVQRHWFPIDFPEREAQSDQAILLDRSLLDEELRRSALAAGATVAGAPVESARIPRGGDLWEIVATGSRIWRARFLVDAAGRHSFLNRQRIFLGTPTLAIETRWSGLSMPKRSTYLEA